MVFQSKMTPFKRWVEPERIQKYVNFFGPGVDAEVRKAKRPDNTVFCWGGLMTTKGYYPAWEDRRVVLLTPLTAALLFL